MSLDFWGIWKTTSRLEGLNFSSIIALNSSLGTAGRALFSSTALGSLNIINLFINYIFIFLNFNLKFLGITPSLNTF